MKKTFLSITLLAAGAVAAAAEERMTDEQLLKYAVSLSPCDEGLTVLSASYSDATEGRIAVTCGPLPGVGLGAAGTVIAGVGLAAIAAGGGGGSTPDTQ